MATPLPLTDNNTIKQHEVSNDEIGGGFVAMEGPIPSHFPSQNIHDGTIFHSAPFPAHPTLASQQDIGLDPFPFDPQLDQPEIHHPNQRNAFENGQYERQRGPPRFQEIRSNGSVAHQSNGFGQPDNGMFGVLPQTRRQQHPGKEVDRGQFGVLSPHPQLLSQHLNHDEQLGRLQHELDLRPVPVTDGGTTEGHFSNMKRVLDPPNLQEWRQKLFDVDETITLTEDE